MIYTLIPLASLIIVLGCCVQYRRMYLRCRAKADELKNVKRRLETILHGSCADYFYGVSQTKSDVFVFMYRPDIGIIPIKRFYGDDEKYIELCAEELLEKLNEKI